MSIIGWFPGVITFRVSSPFDEILQGMTAPKVSVISDGLHFILHFAFDKVRWWSGKVQSMLCHFMVG
jgi:hypothetical protein